MNPTRYEPLYAFVNKHLFVTFIVVSMVVMPLTGFIEYLVLPKIVWKYLITGQLFFFAGFALSFLKEFR